MLQPNGHRTGAWPADCSLSSIIIGIAGAVVVVTDKDRVLDLETMGYSNLPAGKPMQPSDLFYIASMTKCFTATALMMMVDEGKVNIDDPVEKYLPEFKGQMVEEAENKGHPHLPQHPITIKEVMSHTAGIAGRSQASNASRWKTRSKRSPNNALHWEPGTKIKYSPGPEIGGRIVEVVSGIPYCQFIQERLLDPLGMKDTTFWPNAEQASHLALTHDYNPTDQDAGATSPQFRAGQRSEKVRDRAADHFVAVSGQHDSTPMRSTLPGRQAACSPRPPTWQSSARCCSGAAPTRGSNTFPRPHSSR